LYVSYCYDSPEEELYAESTFKYSSTGYPVRTNTNSYNLTNTTTEVRLYLLSTTEGDYTTVTVVDANSNPLADAHITWERSIAGNVTLVAEDDTDDSGSATFWVNPDYPHTLTVTRATCDTEISTITPAQASYLVPLNCEGIEYEYESRVEGVSHEKRPRVGIVQKQDDVLFEYKIRSSIYNMSAVKFRLLDFSNRSNVYGENETLTVNGTFCGLNYCILTLTQNISDNYSNIIGEYYVKMEGDTSYTLLEADGQWMLINVTERSGSILDTLRRLSDYMDTGGVDEDGQTIEEKKTEFTKILLMYFLLAIFFALIGRTTGYDAANPGAFLGIMTALLIIISATGYLTIQNVTFGAANGFFDTYMIALVSGLFAAGLSLSMLRRQTQ
jgi:hypothetical protein